MSSFLAFVSDKAQLTTIVTLPKVSNLPGLSELAYRTWGVAWKNLGPLWSVYTPPEACKTITTGDYFLVANVTEFSTPTQSTKYRCESWLTSYEYLSSNCVPNAPESAELVSQNEFNFVDGVYAAFDSPGLRCPSAWEAVGKYTLAPSVTSVGANVDVPSWASHLLRTGGTHVVCCPSGWTHYAQGYTVGLFRRFYPFICSSRVTTATSGDYCNSCFTDSLTLTTRDGTTTSVCPDLTSYEWGPSQTKSSLGYSVNAIYMIHNRKDLDGPPPTSAAAVIVPSVVVPILALGLAILCLLLILRRRKRQRIRQATKIVNVRKYDQEVKDIDRSTLNPELEDNGRYELEQGTRPARYELSGEHDRQEAEASGPGPELEDTGRQELGYSTNSRHEVPSSLQPGAPLVGRVEPQAQFDNSAFEEFPSAVDVTQNTRDVQSTEVAARIARLNSEREALNERIRHMQMQELLEQRRRIEDEIDALQT